MLLLQQRSTANACDINTVPLRKLFLVLLPTYCQRGVLPFVCNIQPVQMRKGMACVRRHIKRVQCAMCWVLLCDILQQRLELCIICIDTSIQLLGPMKVSFTLCVCIYTSFRHSPKEVKQSMMHCTTPTIDILGSHLNSCMRSPGTPLCQFASALI